MKQKWHGRPLIFAELFNGDIWLLGAEFGCELNSVKMSSSGARKDMSGFTMDFSTQERRPVVFLAQLAQLHIIMQL
jgi:hypothetical protein